MALHRDATLSDVIFVAHNMRVEDVEECRAGGLTPLDALTLSYYERIIAYTLLTPEGTPAAILGINASPISDKFGIIWMLGTDAIKQHRFTFLRNCKPYLQSVYELTGKDCFYNYTYHKNDLHHAWLKWLGFTFIRRVSLPPHNEIFYEFVKLKESN